MKHVTKIFSLLLNSNKCALRSENIIKNKMSRRSFAFISRLSQETSQPDQANQAMHKLFSANLKLVKKTSTLNLLQQLMKKGIGTNDAERCYSLISGQLSNKTSLRKVVITSMRIKIEDAERCKREAKNDFIWSKRECYKVIRPGTFIAIEFGKMMYFECGGLWRNLREHNRQKIAFLWDKYKPRLRRESNTRHEPDIRGVKFRDEDIGETFDDKNEEAVVYGDIELSKEAESAAKLNPKLMDFQKINKFDMMVSCEKGAAILRYKLMGEEREDRAEQERKSTETLDLENKIFNQGNKRATDIPTIQSYIIPKPSSLKNETSIQSALDGFEKVIDKHIRETKSSSILSHEEKQGIKELKTKISKDEAVVFKRDKCGKLTVDSVENYSRDLKTHVTADTIITRENLEYREEKNNQHHKCINSIFGVGAEHRKNYVERVNNASISTNVEPPALRGQRKTHKGGDNPPLRALCGGTEAPNARLGHGVGCILTDFADADLSEHEMKSSEEMRAKFASYNKDIPPEVKKKCFVNSMDAKALYPSVTKDVANQAIKDLVDRTDLEMKNVDYWEAAKYVAVHCNVEEIEQAGLVGVIPARVTKTTRKLTVNCLITRGDDVKWAPAQDPDDNQKRKLVALVLCIANQHIMSNHVYKLGDDLYLQTDGAPIGSEYGGIIARVTTRLFDRRYLKKVAEKGMNVVMYGRYIDDINQVIMKVSDEDDEKTTSDLYREVADGCCDNIVWEADLPSSHPSNSIPILDMRVWMNGDGVLLHKHYEKPMSSKQVISARSVPQASAKDLFI